MLLKQRCSDAVERFITIEGDPEFFVLLCRNMGQFGDVTPVNALLASERRLIPSLVKHHRGTAAALGNEMVEAMPLDDLEDLKGRAVDVLKVDVDGFDGQVLEGAKALLAAHQPAVIFEWHPKLIEATGNAPSQPFVALRNAGYARYLWFGNTGIFSHFSGVPTDLELAKHARYLLGANARSDEHFDVIALPDSLALDEVELALMQMAREWRYRR